MEAGKSLFNSPEVQISNPPFIDTHIKHRWRFFFSLRDAFTAVADEA